MNEITQLNPVDERKRERKEERKTFRENPVVTQVDEGSELTDDAQWKLGLPVKDKFQCIS